MTSTELANLATLGHLKPEPPVQAELDGLLRSGEARLKDARRSELSFESRFDLAYNAAHAFALAALRWSGYRSDRRYVVFQALQHSVGLGANVWRVLAKCHANRNRAEYEGYLEVDEQLLDALLGAAETVNTAVRQLGPIPSDVP